MWPCCRRKRRRQPDDQEQACSRPSAAQQRRHHSGPRKDGRYVGAFYALTTAGSRKRVYVYGRTREEAHERLVEEQAKAGRGIPVPDRSWKLGPYLDYWLVNVVKPTRRPATYALYETNIRLHLAPGLGKYQLKRLSVPLVQAFLNGKIRQGQSVRNVQILRQILSAALSRPARGTDRPQCRSLRRAAHMGAGPGRALVTYRSARVPPGCGC